MNRIVTINAPTLSAELTFCSASFRGAYGRDRAAEKQSGGAGLEPDRYSGSHQGAVEASQRRARRHAIKTTKALCACRLCSHVCAILSLNDQQLNDQRRLLPAAFQLGSHQPGPAA